MLVEEKYDQLMFTPSNDGDFSSKLYAEEIRPKGIQQGQVPHWRLHYVLRSCLSAFHASFSIHHIYCGPIWWLIDLQLGCNDIVLGVIFSD